MKIEEDTIIKNSKSNYKNNNDNILKKIINNYNK